MRVQVGKNDPIPMKKKVFVLYYKGDLLKTSKGYYIGTFGQIGDIILFPDPCDNIYIEEVKKGDDTGKEKTRKIQKS
jgi:hypothetical protein